MGEVQIVFGHPPKGMDHNCGTCRHRAYGDQRMISQCALKVLGDRERKEYRVSHGVKLPAPKARDFGRKCARWRVMAGIIQSDGSIFYGHADNPPDP